MAASVRMERAVRLLARVRQCVRETRNLVVPERPVDVRHAEYAVFLHPRRDLLYAVLGGEHLRIVHVERRVVPVVPVKAQRNVRQQLGQRRQRVLHRQSAAVQPVSDFSDSPAEVRSVLERALRCPLLLQSPFAVTLRRNPPVPLERRHLDGIVGRVRRTGPALVGTPVPDLQVQSSGVERLVLRLAVKRRDLQSRAVHHERERLHRDSSMRVEKVESFGIPLVESPAGVAQR